MAAKQKALTSWSICGAAGLFAASTYSAYRYATHHKEIADVTGTPSDGCTCAFNALADRYDAAIGSEETWMGFGILRSWYLHRHAQGDVLEISAGTGRNLPYYNYPAITHLTLTDLSRPMLLRAEDKFFDELRLGNKHPDTRITFAISDAHCMVQEPSVCSSNADEHQAKTDGKRSRWWSWANSATSSNTSEEEVSSRSPNSDEEKESKKIKPLQGGGGSLLNIFRVLVPGQLNKVPDKEPPAAFVEAHTFDDASTRACCSSGRSLDGEILTRFPPASFDTVVDTFGLCSHANPVKVLQEAARLCKPDGKIVLLEHGRGHGNWMNTRLDDGADRHHRQWGCYWNRDILGIVRQAGLVIDYVSRWHFGTTYIIVARPP